MCGGVEGVKRDAHLDGEREGGEGADGDGEVDEGLQVGVWEADGKFGGDRTAIQLRTIPLSPHAPERADLANVVNTSFFSKLRSHGRTVLRGRSVRLSRGLASI